MVNVTNHRVQDNDISVGQKAHELEEFQTEHTRIGIPVIPDAGISPPLAIIEKVNLCIHNIREKKSSKGLYLDVDILLYCNLHQIKL